uniref:C2H2-type domain-containing protein n=1 Tax=Eptatretus burgeri TaxID=7764 RepID=A0A8C4QMI0_EPTBU
MEGVQVSTADNYKNASQAEGGENRGRFRLRPYACRVPGCPKRYTDPSSLRKHVRSAHRPPAPTALSQTSIERRSSASTVEAGEGFKNLLSASPLVRFSEWDEGKRRRDAAAKAGGGGQLSAFFSNRRLSGLESMLPPRTSWYPSDGDAHLPEHPRFEPVGSIRVESCSRTGRQLDNFNMGFAPGQWLQNDYPGLSRVSNTASDYITGSNSTANVAVSSFDKCISSQFASCSGTAQFDYSNPLHSMSSSHHNFICTASPLTTKDSGSYISNDFCTSQTEPTTFSLNECVRWNETFHNELALTGTEMQSNGIFSIGARNGICCCDAPIDLEFLQQELLFSQDLCGWPTAGTDYQANPEFACKCCTNQDANTTSYLSCDNFMAWTTPLENESSNVAPDNSTTCYSLSQISTLCNSNNTLQPLEKGQEECLLKMHDGVGDELSLSQTAFNLQESSPAYISTHSLSGPCISGLSKGYGSSQIALSHIVSPLDVSISTNTQLPAGEVKDDAARLENKACGEICKGQLTFSDLSHVFE